MISASVGTVLTLSTIRTVALWIFGFLASAMITAFISANVRRWASEKGHDSYFVRLVEFIPERGWINIRQWWWAWLCLGLSGGFGGALWLQPATSLPSPDALTRAAAETKAQQATEDQEHISKLEAKLNALNQEHGVPTQQSPTVDGSLISGHEKELAQSILALKPFAKSVVINRSSSTPGNDWSELAQVFRNAGFGDNVATGFQEPASIDEYGSMICSKDPLNPSDLDIKIRQMLDLLRMEPRFIPLSECRYKGDITIFFGPKKL